MIQVNKKANKKSIIAVGGGKLINLSIDQIWLAAKIELSLLHNDGIVNI